MGDHTECVRLVYDPEVISYTGLLGVFWRSHDSSARVTMQYASLLLPLTLLQSGEATAALAAAPRGSRTVVKEGGTFTPAELRHQKHFLQGHPALHRCLGNGIDLATSHVATRLNGYLGGRATISSWTKEWGQLGLTQEQAEYVRGRVVRRM